MGAEPFLSRNVCGSPIETCVLSGGRMKTPLVVPWPHDGTGLEAGMWGPEHPSGRWVP